MPEMNRARKPQISRKANKNAAKRKTAQGGAIDKIRRTKQGNMANPTLFMRQLERMIGQVEKGAAAEQEIINRYGVGYFEAVFLLYRYENACLRGFVTRQVEQGGITSREMGAILRGEAL